MLSDPKAKLLVLLDHAEEDRSLALRSRDRAASGRAYERILALHVEIAEELEALTDWPGYIARKRP
jgi:hypothetical protein